MANLPGGAAQFEFQKMQVSYPVILRIIIFLCTNRRLLAIAH